MVPVDIFTWYDSWNDRFLSRLHILETMGSSPFQWCHALAFEGGWNCLGGWLYTYSKGSAIDQGWEVGKRYEGMGKWKNTQVTRRLRRKWCSDSVSLSLAVELDFKQRLLVVECIYCVLPLDEYSISVAAIYRYHAFWCVDMFQRLQWAYGLSTINCQIVRQVHGDGEEEFPNNPQAKYIRLP